MLANSFRPYTAPFFQDKWQSPPEDQLLLSLVVGNKPGVLGRIALVFSRRGFNIEFLNVHHTLDRRFSHMMIMSQGSIDRFQEIVKNCQKIIDVIHVTPVLQSQADDQEAQKALRLEITCHAEHKKLILQCIQYSSFQIVDFQDQVLMIEKSQREHTDEAMLAILKHYADIRIIDDSLNLSDEENELATSSHHNTAPSTPGSQLSKGAAL
ncbi:MAG: acetolactate synthase small subunit [Oligoflexus sp.]